MMREKVPGITIRTTLIAGYPGETEEDHQVVLDWVREQRFDRLGVFAYSHEEIRMLLILRTMFLQR